MFKRTELIEKIRQARDAMEVTYRRCSCIEEETEIWQRKRRKGLGEWRMEKEREVQNI